MSRPHPCLSCLAVVSFLLSSHLFAASTYLPDAPVPQQTSSASSQDPAWRQVERLNPDDSVEILENGRRNAFPCRLDRVDDTLIACNIYPLHLPPRRVTVPAANVSAVYLDEEVYSNGPRLAPVLVTTAIGTALGAAACRESSGSAIVVCAFIGAALGALAPFMLPPGPFPPRPHFRRRLIYRAP